MSSAISKLAVVVLAVVLGSGPAAGQSVVLPKELGGIPGEWIVVVPESVDGGPPRWRWSPGLEEVRLDALFGPELASKARGKVFRSRVLGTHTVEAWNAKADQASAIATCRVTIVAQTAEPPKPPDKPPEVPGSTIWAVVIRPDAPITPEQAMTLKDAVWGRLEAKGVKVMNKSLANVKEPTLREEVKGVTLPAFLLLRATATGSVTVVPARPLPSPAEIEKLVEGIK